MNYSQLNEKARQKMWLTNDYYLKDFASGDGKEVPEEYVENAKKLAVALQTIKEAFGKNIILSSVYRSPEHNAAVEGKSKSYHLLCMAADLKVEKSADLETLYTTIASLMANKKIPAGGLKKYNTFIHYDIRGKYVTW